jgi:hypothetical protein
MIKFGVRPLRFVFISAALVIAAFAWGVSSQISNGAQVRVVTEIAAHEAPTPQNLDWLIVNPWPSSERAIRSSEISRAE